MINSTLRIKNTIIITIIVTIRNIISILALSAVLIINALEIRRIITLDKYITVVIINIYSKFLSLFFILNTSNLSLVNNSSTIIFSNNIFT